MSYRMRPPFFGVAWQALPSQAPAPFSNLIYYTFIFCLSAEKLVGARLLTT